MQKIRYHAWIMSAVILLTSFSGCTKGDNRPPVSSGGDYDSSGHYQLDIPDVSKELAQAIETNPDVVGWLQMPNTKINEPVVQTSNNEYYLRLDWKGNSAYEGCYYLDYESVVFDDGKNLAQNSIVYGHNLGSPLGTKDDPNGVKFAQLLKLEDIDTAQDTPYFYFSTPKAVHVFEIFAVFYSEDHIQPVPYHYAEYNVSDFTELIKDVKNRSLYDYDVDVEFGDHIMTLSTCSYKYGTYTQNPNQRYVVMGRLISEEDETHEKAKLKVNENPKAPDFSNTGAS